PSLHRLYDAVFFHPKPVVMAVNGHAMAGGAVLAACGDRRIMAANSGRIGITEMLVGVPLPALAFEIVRFAVPPRYLAEFALTGATYPTADALHKGWIDEVVEPGALMTRAMEAARFYAALSPAAFAQTKTQVRQSVSERMALSGAATDRTVTKIWTESATLDRVAAYVAKTLSKA
ncbi:MAG TPA: enoyl-CoA hydratase-related protein, partial [Rhizomicrobium sp.]